DQRGLAVVDVGDDGDVAKFHSSSSGSDNGWSSISPENRDPLFRIALKEFWWAQPSKGRFAPKKEARPKGPGTPYSLRRNIVRNRRKTMRCLRFGELIFATSCGRFQALSAGSAG
nr:hypothetical protein [Bradyrhizobium sp.]